MSAWDCALGVGSVRRSSEHTAPQYLRYPARDMLCPARCSCFLCRELQSCRAADSRKPTKNSMCDNFILKKAEAWESSGAMKFIRGAARLSVRHWQSREPAAPVKARLSAHKSTSCEQLYPHPSEEEPPHFGMRRAPSTDRVKSPPEHKPLFKILGNSRKKLNNSDASEMKTRRSVLNFRKSEPPNNKNVHEKYIPLPQMSNLPTEHIYSEPRCWSAEFDNFCRPPVYQSVVKSKNKTNTDNNSKDSISEKKIYSNRPPCYEELAQRLSQDKNKKPNIPLMEGGLANKITQNNNKVVIYFGDSIIRKHSEEKKDEINETEQTTEEVIYANRLLDETANLGLGREVDKGGGTTLVSEVEVQEGIYSEIKSDHSRETAEVVPTGSATYKKETFETITSDGFLVVEIEGNFEKAQQLVDFMNGGGSADHHEATVLDEDAHCDWSFIQGWRKRSVTDF